jgi:hypothetical protein
VFKNHQKNCRRGNVAEPAVAKRLRLGDDPIKPGLPKREFFRSDVQTWQRLVLEMVHSCRLLESLVEEESVIETFEFLCPGVEEHTKTKGAG